VKINIRKRGPVVKNLIFFVILSFIYLFIVESINNGESALNISSLKDFCLSNIFTMCFSVIVIYFIYSLRKVSKWMLLIYFGFISFHSFAYFFENFDKLILIYSFIHLLFSGYFYIFWDLELKDVVYSPGYSFNQIGLLNKQNLNVKLSINELEYFGFLTNIGENSCFIYVEGLNNIEGTKVFVSLEFEGREFCSEGELVTTFFNGVGLKVDQSFRLQDKRTWSEYYGIIMDRSIYPLITGINK